MKTIRKASLLSKKKVSSLISLFEQKVDKEIELINVRTNQVQTTDWTLYSIDFSKNSVESVYDTTYIVKGCGWDDF